MLLFCLTWKLYPLTLLNSLHSNELANSIDFSKEFRYTKNNEGCYRQTVLPPFVTRSNRFFGERVGGYFFLFVI